MHQVAEDVGGILRRGFEQSPTAQAPLLLVFTGQLERAFTADSFGHFSLASHHPQICAGVMDRHADAVTVNGTIYVKG